MEVLARALEILDGGEAWHQGFYAITGDGDNVGSCDENAAKFCTAGAIYRAAQEMGEPKAYLQGIYAIAAQTGRPNVTAWNDDPERTFAQVREVFRRAAFEGSGARGSERVYA